MKNRRCGNRASRRQLYPSCSRICYCCTSPFEEGLSCERPSTRDKIVSAMYALVAEKGYDKASMNQACRRRRLQTGVVLLFRIERRAVLGHGESLYPVLDPDDTNSPRSTTGESTIRICMRWADRSSLPRGRRAPTRSRGNRHAGDELPP